MTACLMKVSLLIAHELLNRYKEKNEQVMHISGNNFLSKKYGEDSYLFY